MSARMPRFPDSPEGVALALAYLVAQSKAKQPDAQPPDMVELHRKCLEVVIGGEIVGTLH
jgi:hypothetical protein